MSDLQDMPMNEQPDDMIHVRVPADLREAIAREAEKESRTLSGQVRHLLRAELMRRPTPAAA